MSTLRLPAHPFDASPLARATPLRLVPSPENEVAPPAARLADPLSPHMPYLLAVARRLTRNEADARDLVQDTCVSALESLAHGAAAPGHVRGWLVVVMRNNWFNVVRHKRVRTNARAELTSRASVDTGLCETRAVCDQLERAWDQLAAQAQSIARQCLIDGDSYEEVSRRLGMTTGGVACSIHRTREQLRRTMFGEP